MNRVLAAVVLMFAIVATGQQPTQPGTTPTNQKTIKDPAEYNAYITALNTQDQAAKGAAMEAFVKQYPQSVVLTDALIEARAAYQKAGNQAKVEEMARRILQLIPNDVTSLAIVTLVDRQKATASGDPAALKESCDYAQNGLQQVDSWKKPEGMSDADFETVRKGTTDIFYGATGFCALQKKDFAAARTAYEKAFQLDPTNLQDVYQLAVADLEANPIDVNGFWYCSKALGLAQKLSNAQAVNGMAAYCKAKYKRYHGGEDGWDQVVASAATQNALPSDFAAGIKPAPTPCELAVQAVQQNDPASLSFGDKEFILSKANCSADNKKAADKVWQSIQDMQKGGEARLKIPEVKVVAATKDSVDVAITDDNKAADKADVHVVMEKPLVSLPAKGKTTDVIGVLTSYTPDPFMFTMEKGELPGAKPPAPRRPVRKKKG